jgi:arsenite methyltransferase
MYYVTSRGHDFSTGDWLDLHFDACQQEYENMVRAIGIQQGWTILDAGCGNGRYLNVLHELIGDSGKLYSVDIAYENIYLAKKLLSKEMIPSPRYSLVGDVRSLSFPNSTFDLVWCSSVTQYLNKTDLNYAISEFRRVLKPGGILAIKEVDGSSYYFYPTRNITLLWDTVSKIQDPERLRRYFIQPLDMLPLLREHGFSHLHQTTNIIERRNPLDDKTRKYLEELFNTEDVNWSKIEVQTLSNQAEWKRIMDHSSPDYILNNPRFYWREGHILVIGRS